MRDGPTNRSTERPTRRVLETNKAVYTAALVADGWAGAENLKQRLCDGRTDMQICRHTDIRMDRWTKKSLIEN